MGNEEVSWARRRLWAKPDESERDKERERLKKYRKENPKKVNKSRKKFLKNHPGYYKNLREKLKKENPDVFYIQNKEWRERNPTMLKEQGNRYQKKLKKDPARLEKLKRNTKSRTLFKLYGITLEQLEYMIISQNNLCKICNKPFNEKIWGLRPVIDHIHGTKIIRGILHCKCNMDLKEGAEGIEYYKNAIAYIEKYLSAPNEKARKLDSILQTQASSSAQDLLNPASEPPASFPAK